MSEESLADLRVYFAFVCEGKLADFLKAADYIENHTTAHIIFRRKALNYLRIVNDPEVKRHERSTSNA